MWLDQVPALNDRGDEKLGTDQSHISLHHSGYCVGSRLKLVWLMQEERDGGALCQGGDRLCSVV